MYVCMYVCIRGLFFQSLSPTKIQNCLMYFFYPMSGSPHCHIACTRLLTFEAVIPSHFVFPVHFDNFYAVNAAKENNSYVLFIGAFI